jgi:hypothetical protein
MDDVPALELVPPTPGGVSSLQSGSEGCGFKQLPAASHSCLEQLPVVVPHAGEAASPQMTSIEASARA